MENREDWKNSFIAVFLWTDVKQIDVIFYLNECKVTDFPQNNNSIKTS